MLTPQQFQELFQLFDQLGTQLKQAPPTPEFDALSRDVQKVNADLKELSTAPTPDELKPEYIEGLIKETEVQLAALKQEEQQAKEEPAEPAEESFVAWDGDALSQELLAGLGIAATTEPELPAMPVRPPTTAVDLDALRRAIAQAQRAPLAPEDLESLKMPAAEDLESLKLPHQEEQ